MKYLETVKKIFDKVDSNRIKIGNKLNAIGEYLTEYEEAKENNLFCSVCADVFSILIGVALGFGLLLTLIGLGSVGLYAFLLPVM